MLIMNADDLVKSKIRFSSFSKTSLKMTKNEPSLLSFEALTLKLPKQSMGKCDQTLKGIMMVSRKFGI